MDPLCISDSRDLAQQIPGATEVQNHLRTVRRLCMHLRDAGEHDNSRISSVAGAHQDLAALPRAPVTESRQFVAVSIGDRRQEGSWRVRRRALHAVSRGQRRACQMTSCAVCGGVRCIAQRSNAHPLGG